MILLDVIIHDIEKESVISCIAILFVFVIVSIMFDNKRGMCRFKYVRIVTESMTVNPYTGSMYAS